MLAAALSERLTKGLRQAFDELGMAGQVTGLGSMLNVHLTPHPVVDYRSAAKVRPVVERGD
jgi:glutamate-1-semialdehyde aminotransferase